MPEATLLTTAEVAARVGRTRTTVIEWVKAGRLKPTRKLPTSTGAYLFSERAVAKLEKELAA